MSMQTNDSLTGGTTGGLLSPTWRVLRYSVAVVVLLLTGWVIVITPSQIRREMIIRNESSDLIVLSKVELISFDLKLMRSNRREMGTDLELPAKSAVRLPIYFAERGYRQVTFADGRVLPMSMSFGWGETEVFTYKGTSEWGFNQNVSSLRRLAYSAVEKLPSLNWILY